MFLEIDEVLDIARAGAALGCKEALFTLGDRPEDRWPQARSGSTSAATTRLLQYDAGRHPGAGGDRSTPAPEPRRDVGEDPRLKPVAPSMA